MKTQMLSLHKLEVYNIKLTMNIYNTKKYKITCACIITNQKR